MSTDFRQVRQRRGVTVAQGRHPAPWVRAALALLHAGARLGPPVPRPDAATYRFPEPGLVQAGRVTLNAYRWKGTGPTLLLVHGLNANAWIWARVACLLHPERDVVAVELRGHGFSDVPAQGYAHEQTSADLEAFLDALGLDQVDLAGHSWGGMVVTHFAGSRPQRVRSLILADPVLPHGLNPAYRWFDAVMDALFAAERGPFPDEASWWAAYRTLVFLRHDDEMDRRFWRTNFRRLEDGTFHHRLPDEALEEILYTTLMTDIRGVAARIRCPVLLMNATTSINFFPGERWWIRRNLFPREVLVTGDHSFIHSNSRDTARFMRAFLHEVSPVR